MSYQADHAGVPARPFLILMKLTPGYSFEIKFSTILAQNQLSVILRATALIKNRPFSAGYYFTYNTYERLKPHIYILKF